MIRAYNEAKLRTYQGAAGRVCAGVVPGPLECDVLQPRLVEMCDVLATGHD